MSHHASKYGCGCASPATTTRFRPHVECLESRLLMTATDQELVDVLADYDTLRICGCPICTGKGLEQIPVQTASVAGTIAANQSLSGLPQLNSLQGARASLHLDFDGHITGTWGSYSGVTTPAFDQDGDTTTFSTSELVSINEIWKRVAEDFAPFNINVTTIDPGNLNDRATAKIVIGGHYNDWFNQSAGGVAYLGGFYNGASNIGFVFDDALGNGNPRFVAEAASHEAGHLFGLHHQSVWSGNNLVANYSTGSNGWAPVMGVGYYQNVTTWHTGPTPAGASAIQDDMSLLAGSFNGFGYRPDDFGNTSAAAHSLNRIAEGGEFTIGGIISTNDDVDVFSFETIGGSALLRVNGIGVGQNLDAVLELRNATGTTLATANTANLDESITKNLSPGVYYVFVRSTGAYGRIGQYTLSGQFRAPRVLAPEITVTVDRKGIESGQGEIAFGNIQLGKTAQKVVTIRNTGTAPLTLTPFDTKNVPRGFTIVSNIRSTSLKPGASTTFTVAVNSRVAGTYSGRLTILSNDSNEGRFAIPLTASVATATSPTRQVGGGEVKVIDDGQAGFSTTGTWTRATGGGNAGDRMLANKGTGQSVASWQFTGLTPGRYRVSATWVADRTLATNAKYEIHSADRRLGAVTINQERTPASFTASNVKWQDLGFATITGDSITIQLSNNANDRVMADAIRLEKVSTGSTVVRNTSFSLRAPALSATIEDGWGEELFHAQSQESEAGHLDWSLGQHGAGSQSVHQPLVTTPTGWGLRHPLGSAVTNVATSALSSSQGDEAGALEEMDRLRFSPFQPLLLAGSKNANEPIAAERSLAMVMEILELPLDQLAPG